MNDNKKYYCVCCNKELIYYIYRDAFICNNIHDKCDYNCGDEAWAPYIYIGQKYLIIKYSAYTLPGAIEIFSFIEKNITKIDIIYNYLKSDPNSWIEEKIKFDYAFTKEQASSFIKRFNDNAIFK